MPTNHFDESIAAGYDDAVAEMFDPAALDPAVDFLAALAGSGAALEFGIGTGRVALPLNRRGVPVSGVELSPAMAERLGAKPGGEHIPVTIGDLTDTRLEGSFRLVYLVFNTIMNLTTQDAQVACFRNAAAHLEPGGAFVVEVGVPDLRRLPPGETVRAFTVSPTHLGFDEYTDFAAQQMTSHHFRPGAGAVVDSVPFRYVWPAELDLMARLAGMTLEQRVSDWTGDPFTGESTSHVSVWRTAG